MKCLLVYLILLVALVAQPVFSQDIDEALAAYWSFNEDDGETVRDSTDNGHDGTLIGNPKWIADGKYGGALEFAEAENEVNIPFHVDLNENIFTVCAWVNVKTGGTGHRAVVSSRDDGPQRGYIFYVVPNNSYSFWAGGGGWSQVQGPAASLDEWDHIAGTYADGTMKFYVNGEMAGSKDANIALNTEQELLIGAGQNEGAKHNFFFKGKIDEVRIYDAALDADTILAVMNYDVSTDVEVSDKLTTTWARLKHHR